MLWRCCVEEIVLRKRAVGAALALLLAGLLALGIPGASAQVPGVTQSDNVEFITTVPDVGMISGEFARTGDFYYTSALTNVSAYDVSDPENPQLLDKLPTVNFE